MKFHTLLFFVFAFPIISYPMELQTNAKEEEMEKIQKDHEKKISDLSMQVAALTNAINSTLPLIYVEINKLNALFYSAQHQLAFPHPAQQIPVVEKKPEKPQVGLEFHGPKFIPLKNQKRKAAAMQPQNPRIVHTAPSKDIEKSMQDLGKRLKKNNLNLNVTEQELQKKHIDNEKDSRS